MCMSSVPLADIHYVHPSFNKSDYGPNIYCMHAHTLPGATAFANARFGQGTGPIVMDEVRCTASEVRLMDCPFSLSHDCGHHQDAGVRCTLSIYGNYIL